MALRRLVRVNLDFLVKSFDPFLEPTGLVRGWKYACIAGRMCRNMCGCTMARGFHSDGGHLQAQHVVDEDRPIHVGLQ